MQQLIIYQINRDFLLSVLQLDILIKASKDIMGMLNHILIKAPFKLNICPGAVL